ncbi:MAG: hypothetical protein LUH07_07635, partial [Lachnospiraceae bacterium]|nr:hypothetical protein [Lachnospiraceae bacterium]
QTMKEMEKLRASPPRFDPNVDLHTVTMTELYDTVCWKYNKRTNFFLKCRQALSATIPQPPT